MKRIVLGLVAWMSVVTTLHFWLNVNWSEILNDRLPASRRKLNVAYIPVT
jgi:NitT/TauT family transport system substrate-binding protein